MKQFSKEEIYDLENRIHDLERENQLLKFDKENLQLQLISNGVGSSEFKDSKKTKVILENNTEVIIFVPKSIYLDAGKHLNYYSNILGKWNSWGDI